MHENVDEGTWQLQGVRILTANRCNCASCKTTVFQRLHCYHDVGYQKRVSKHASLPMQKVMECGNHSYLLTNFKYSLELCYSSYSWSMELNTLLFLKFSFLRLRTHQCAEMIDSYLTLIHPVFVEQEH